MLSNKKPLFIIIGIISIFVFTSIIINNIFLKEESKPKLIKQKNSIGIIVEGQEQDSFPSKQDYEFEKVVCNGIEVEASDTGTDSFNINISGITTKSNCAFYFTDIPLPLLVDTVEEGDFVAYTPSEATWQTTVAQPTTEGNFGGWTTGQDKSTSVSCFDSLVNEYASGWRVLSNDGEEIKLISAGTPECYYHKYNEVTASITALTQTSGENAAVIKYGSNLSESVKYLDKADLDAWNGSSILYQSTISNNLISIATRYWIASAYDTYRLWYIRYDGYFYYNSSCEFGLRPLITLKPNIQVISGTGESIENAYQISL